MKKVLIVEDEKILLLSLLRGLNKHSSHFQIMCAENGRQAVEVLSSIEIDLLVTDLKMPEMNGFELLAWVSRNKAQLPVVVTSAFATPETQARLGRMGTLQFLEKPFSMEDMEAAIFNGLKSGDKSYIRGITLATFLQLVKAEHKDCTLKVMSGGQQAFLFVNNGDLIDADFGGLSGRDAAMKVVAWPDAEIEMESICRRHSDSIGMPVEQLLLAAFQRKDEEAEFERQQS